MVSFSIIIPTLREEAHIGQLLQALGQQDYSGSVEIIVVDGGSMDRTQEIVRQFPNVRLLIKEPANTSAQRNLGAAAAQGVLLVFMDADNKPGNSFLSGLARTYQKKSFAVACPWFVADSSNWIIRGIYVVFNCLFWLSQWHFHTGSGVCISVKRDIFLTLGGFDEDLHLGEDIHLIRRAAQLGPHRHLCIPIRTSARRFERFGIWHMVRFYARLSPLLLTGRFTALQKIAYPAAPYSSSADS